MSIELKRVTKVYRMGDDTIHALAGVTMAVAAGELAAITGASGSGKSTLMNIIGCLDRPTSGAYFLEGEDVAGFNDDQLAATRNRHIGFVFQNFNLLPRMTAWENVALPLVYAGADRRTAARKAAAAMELVGLAARKDHRPNELSGGQRQRVAIARALVNEPAVILADEPTGNLDSKASYEVMEIFCRLNQEGRTVVMVTHEGDIAAYARRVIRVRDGQIVADEAGEGVDRCSGKAY
jgi:putative ABC transport system ATP-binding protein